MRTILLISAALLVAMGCASTGTRAPYARMPGLEVTTIDQPYTVIGSTAEELRGSMRLNGPVSSTFGRRVSGQARWSIRWRFTYGTTRGACRIVSVEVPITITIILPDWKPPADAPPELIDEWNVFLDALAVHEDGHRLIAIQAAQEIVRKFKRMRGTTCSFLGNDANAEGRRIVAEYNQKNKDYDAETQHGQTQGVIWPPRRRR